MIRRILLQRISLCWEECTVFGGQVNVLQDCPSFFISGLKRDLPKSLFSMHELTKKPPFN
jgi:hypothetical protein